MASHMRLRVVVMMTRDDMRNGSRRAERGRGEGRRLSFTTTTERELEREREPLMRCDENNLLFFLASRKQHSLYKQQPHVVVVI